MSEAGPFVDVGRRKNYGRRADALHECLRLAQDAQLAREALADLRAALARAEARALEGALLEAERRFCRCGEAPPCGLHALVRRALDGPGEGKR
jgi:hypothetical protein